jgi:hypothetical protein
VNVTRPLASLRTTEASFLPIMFEKSTLMLNSSRRCSLFPATLSAQQEVG